MIEHLLTYRATIRRRVATRGQSGGLLHDQVLIANNVPCRVVPSDADEGAIGGRMRGTERTTIYFAPGAPVKETDEVTVDGITYEVRGAHENSERRAYRKAICEQRRVVSGRA